VIRFKGKQRGWHQKKMPLGTNEVRQLGSSKKGGDAEGSMESEPERGEKKSKLLGKKDRVYQQARWNRPLNISFICGRGKIPDHYF